jgi:predicted deacetylase
MNNVVSLQNQDTTLLCPYKIRLYTRGKRLSLSWARNSAARDKKRFQPQIILQKKKKEIKEIKESQNLPARLAIINPS